MRIGLRKMFIFNTSREYETFFHMRKNLIYPMINKKEIVITYRYKHKLQEKLLICGHVWEERLYTFGNYIQTCTQNHYNLFLNVLHCFGTNNV